MKLLKIVSVLVILAGMAAVAIVAIPAVPFVRHVLAQERPFDGPRGRALTVLSGRGSSIGVSVRDVQTAEAGGDKEGVLVDDVRSDSPAEKAGLKRGDVIVSFDGERVRSIRQFTRLVQETTPGRSVKSTIVREGKRSDVTITPSENAERRGDVMISGDFGRYFGELGRDLGRLGDRMPSFDFNFDFDNLPGVVMSGRRLGVTIDELTPQLAEYFGAKDGVLVTSVAEGSVAARAGIKAGDVITTVGGSRVDSVQDLQREMRDARDGEDVTIGIVRDKKETSVKAKIEAPARRVPRGRPA